MHSPINLSTVFKHLTNALAAMLNSSYITGLVVVLFLLIPVVASFPRM